MLVSFFPDSSFFSSVIIVFFPFTVTIHSHSLGLSSIYGAFPGLQIPPFVVAHWQREVYGADGRSCGYSVAVIVFLVV